MFLRFTTASVVSLWEGRTCRRPKWNEREPTILMQDDVMDGHGYSPCFFSGWQYAGEIIQDHLVKGCDQIEKFKHQLTAIV